MLDNVSTFINWKIKVAVRALTVILVCHLTPPETSDWILSCTHNTLTSSHEIDLHVISSRLDVINFWLEVTSFRVVCGKLPVQNAYTRQGSLVHDVL